MKWKMSQTDPVPRDAASATQPRDTSSEEGKESEEEVSGKVEPKSASLTDLEQGAASPRREAGRLKPVQLGLALSASPAE